MLTIFSQWRFLKAQSHIPTRTSSAQKNEEFWSVRCDSLGVRQNSLMISRERLMNVIHLSCAPTSTHTFCMFKNVSVFSRVNVDARITLDQRQSNARHKYSTALISLCFLWPMYVSVTHKRRIVHTYKKIKNNNLSPDYEKRSKLVANAQRVFNANGEWKSFC